MNMTGGLPGPFIYGYIKSIYYSQAAMNCTVRATIVGSIAIFIALIVRKRKENRKIKVEEKSIPLREIDQP